MLTAKHVQNKDKLQMAGTLPPLSICEVMVGTDYTNHKSKIKKWKFNNIIIKPSKTSKNHYGRFFVPSIHTLNLALANEI